MKLGQVVIKRVAVAELGVSNGSGDGGSSFGLLLSPVGNVRAVVDLFRSFSSARV